MTYKYKYSDEALKLALEALKAKDTCGSSIREAKERAITACEQALAAPVQEPVNGTQVSKVWWDGEKLMAKPIPLEDIYQPVDWKAEYLKSVESGCITLDELREANAELEATNRQVEILSDALAESRREVASLKANAALDKKAENARELGLDYEPVLKDNSNYRYDPPVAEPAPGDIRALKHRIHELEGEVLGYKQMLDLAEEKLKSAPVQEPVSRTDQQIVDQTEELAVWLLSWCFNHQPETDTPMRESTHPFAERCWAAACHIQEMLTATDPENAVAELDVDATPPAAQPAPVQDAAWEAEQKALAEEAIRCATEALADSNNLAAKAAREYYGAATPPAAKPVQEFTCSTGLCHYKAQRKPLTDEEIEKVWERVQADDFHDCVQPFARAIEAAHGIKENT